MLKPMAVLQFLGCFWDIFDVLKKAFLGFLGKALMDFALILIGVILGMHRFDRKYFQKSSMTAFQRATSKPIFPNPTKFFPFKTFPKKPIQTQINNYLKFYEANRKTAVKLNVSCIISILQLQKLNAKLTHGQSTN
jgi:hypothetical protein